MFSFFPVSVLGKDSGVVYPLGKFLSLRYSGRVNVMTSSFILKYWLNRTIAYLFKGREKFEVKSR